MGRAVFSDTALSFCNGLSVSLLGNTSAKMLGGEGFSEKYRMS